MSAATLARLGPSPGELLWDVGAGCGSISIEWMRAARGCEAIAFEGDATKEDVVAAATAKAVSHYGHLDVIFNMAGIVLWKSVLEMDTAEWTEALASFPKDSRT